MVDRASRNLVAATLRKYVSGRVSNFRLDDSITAIAEDPGAVAVWEMAWTLYDDGHEHRAVGRYELDASVRQEIARWIVFLDTNLEYEWPTYSFMKVGSTLLNSLTFGWWGRQEHKEWTRFKDSGPFEIWPFIRQADLDDALREARRLRGKLPSEQSAPD